MDFGTQAPGLPVQLMMMTVFCAAAAAAAAAAVLPPPPMDGAPWAGIGGWDLSRSKPKTSFKNPFEDASVAGAVAVRQ